ncbi:MAG: diguanylate cyclase [Rhodocyclaceae bacterium]|nr:diguanylate cyclase [Rhodocyclaceae bacterium]
MDAPGNSQPCYRYVTERCVIPTYIPPAEFNTQSLPRQRATLLVVDDQPVNIQLLYAILADDYEIIMATNGDDALRLCEELDPDLILLDIQMPGLSGFDVCQRLKESEMRCETPIIFITAQTKDSEETRCLRAGAVDFIAKPYNAEVVKARVRTHVRLKQQTDLLRSLAFIDPLTGLHNRRRLEEGLHAEWGRCRRSQVPLALLMIDIDHFKLYNDHYGHQIGDACLQSVAAAIRAQFNRSHDIVARFGGEEFVCLMPECDLDGARNKAEDVRRAVQALEIEHQASPTAAVVTLSIGIHSMVPDAENSTEDLVRDADIRLYEAKQQGRNRVAG